QPLAPGELRQRVQARWVAVDENGAELDQLIAVIARGRLRKMIGGEQHVPGAPVGAPVRRPLLTGWNDRPPAERRRPRKAADAGPLACAQVERVVLAARGDADDDRQRRPRG